MSERTFGAENCIFPVAGGTKTFLFGEEIQGGCSVGSTCPEDIELLFAWIGGVGESIDIFVTVGDVELLESGGVGPQGVTYPAHIVVDGIISNVARD